AVKPPVFPRVATLELCCRAAFFYPGPWGGGFPAPNQNPAGPRHSREVVMKRLLAGLFVLLSPSAFAQSTSAPELNFDSVPNFIKLPPDMHLGEASGVAVNSKGNIYVYSRGGTIANAFGATASQILRFDPGGGVLREGGKKL